MVPTYRTEILQVSECVAKSLSSSVVPLLWHLAHPALAVVARRGSYPLWIQVLHAHSTPREGDVKLPQTCDCATVSPECDVIGCESLRTDILGVCGEAMFKLTTSCRAGLESARANDPIDSKWKVNQIFDVL